MSMMRRHKNSIKARRRSYAAGILLSLACFIVPEFFSSSTNTSYAQAPSDDDIQLRKELLEDRYRTDAKRALDRFIPPPEYYIEISITPAPKPAETLPYLPYGLNARLVQSLPISKLQTHVNRVEITVYLSARYDAQAQERIRQIVEKQLVLNAGRGDSLNFSALSMPYEPPNTEYTQQITKLEADIRQMQSDAQTLERERNDFRQQLTVIQAQLDEERQKAAQKVVEKAETKEENNTKEESTTTQSEDPANTKSEEGGTNWTMIALIILGGLVVIGIGLILAGKAMGGAVGKMANAMESVGGAIESGAKVQAEAATVAAPPAGLPVPPAAGGGGGGTKDSGGSSDSPAGLPSLPAVNADAHKIVLELHEELKTALTRESEPVLIAHVSNLLAHAGTKDLAVASLEVFGKDIANELFNKLSRIDQEEVLRIMRLGRFTKPKTDLMIEAGELIKTKLLAGLLRSGNGDLNPQIATKLANLGDDRLLDLVVKLHKDILPRLMIYLDPARIATLCDGLRKKDQRAFTNVVESMTEIPAAYTKKESDDDLLPALTEALEQIEATDQRPYMRFYLDVLESAGSELGEKIYDVIPKNQDDVRNFLQGNFITYSTFFKLAMDVQENIMARLSNLEIANFLLELEEDQKDRIKEILDQKRWELIEDELTRYEDLNKRQLESATRFAREQVVLRIKEVKGDQPLEDLFASENDGGNVGEAA